MIEFLNVEKTYPNGNKAIKNMNLCINDGDFTVFIGPSGSGKTTALKMINRLEDATSGEIRITLGYGVCIAASGIVSSYEC